MNSQRFEFDIRGKRIIAYAASEREARRLADKSAGKLGLGDFVEKVAGPIASALNVRGCGGCAQRRDKLNSLVPDITAPFSRDT